MDLKSDLKMVRLDIQGIHNKFDELPTQTKENTLQIQRIDQKVKDIDDKQDHSAATRSHMLEEIRGLKADMVSVQSKIVTVGNRCNACIPKEDLKKKQIEDQRKLNVMLEGMPETQGGRIYQICQDLFTDLGCIIKATDLLAVNRHGRLPRREGRTQSRTAKLHTLDKWNNTRVYHPICHRNS